MAKKKNFTTDSRLNMMNYLGKLNKEVRTTNEGTPVEFEEIKPVMLQTQPLNTIEFDDVLDQSKQQGISTSSVGTEPTSKDDNREVSDVDNILDNIGKVAKVIVNPIGAMIKAESDILFKPKEDGSSWKDAAFSFIESIWVDDVNRNLGAINLNNQEIDKLSGLMSDTPDNQQLLKSARSKMDNAVLQGNHEDYIKYKQEYDKIKDNFKKSNEAVNTKINSLNAQNEKLKTNLQDARNDVNDLNSIYTLNTAYKNQRDNGEFGFFDPDYWFYKVPLTLGTSFSSIGATGAAMAASAATNYIASSATGIGAHPVVAGGAAILGAGATMYSTLWARNRESLSEVSTNYKSLFKESANKLGIDSDELAKVGRLKLRDLTGYAYSEDPNSKDYRDNEAVLEDMLAYNIKIGDIAPQAKELDKVTNKAKNKLRDLYNNNMALGIGDIAETAIVVPGVGKMFGKVLGKLNLPEIVTDKTVKVLDKTIATIATKAGAKMSKPVLEKGVKYLVDPAVRVAGTSIMEGVEEVTQQMIANRLNDEKLAKNADLYNPFELGKLFAENQYLAAKGMLGVIGISGDPALDNDDQLFENFKGGVAVSLLMGGASQVLTPTSDNAIAKAASFKKGNDMLRFMTTENIKSKEDMFKYIQYANKAKGHFTNKEALLDAIDAQSKSQDMPDGWTQQDFEQEKKNIESIFNISNAVNNSAVIKKLSPEDRSIGVALIKRALDTHKNNIDEYNKVVNKFNAINLNPGGDFNTLYSIGDEDKDVVNSYISTKSKLDAVNKLIGTLEDKTDILSVDEKGKVQSSLDELYIELVDLNKSLNILQRLADTSKTLDSFAKESLKNYINNNVSDNYSVLLLSNKALRDSKLDFQKSIAVSEYLKDKVDKYKLMLSSTEESLNKELEPTISEEEISPEVTADTVAEDEKNVIAREEELNTAEAGVLTLEEADIISELKSKLALKKLDIAESKRTVIEDLVKLTVPEEAINVRTPNLSYDEFDPAVAEFYNEDKEESLVQSTDIAPKVTTPIVKEEETKPVSEPTVQEQPQPETNIDKQPSTKVEPETLPEQNSEPTSTQELETKKEEDHNADLVTNQNVKTPEQVKEDVRAYEENDLQPQLKIDDVAGTIYFRGDSDTAMFKGYKSGKELNKFLSTPGNIASSIFTAVIGKPNSKFGSYKVDVISTWDNAPVYIEIKASNGDKYIAALKTIQGARDMAIRRGKAFSKEEEDNLRKLRNSIIEVKIKYPNSTITFSLVNSTNGLLNVNRDSENRSIQRSLLDIKGLNITDIYQFNESVNSKIGIGKGLAGDYLIYNGDEEIMPGKGGSGKLYYYLSSKDTINGNVIPVKLNEAKFVSNQQDTSAITDYLTTVILDRETNNEYLSYTDILSLVINYGNETILDPADPRYAFMKDKQFFVDYHKGYAQLGTEQIPITSLLDIEGRKKLSSFIALNLHWNTDKLLLFSSLNDPTVDEFVSLENAVRNAIGNVIEIVPGVKIGLSDFGLTKNDKGQIVQDPDHPEGLKLISFLVNKGLLTSDLLDLILTDPFVYVSKPYVTYAKEDPVVDKPIILKETKTQDATVTEEKSNLSTQDEIDLAQSGVTTTRKKNLVSEEETLSKEEIDNNNDLIDDWLGIDGAPKVLTNKQIKESKRINTIKATKWLKSKLGLDDSQVLVIDGVFKLFANGAAVYGITHQDSISISSLAIEGVQYHEAWHRVSLLLLDKELRLKLYTEFRLGNLKYNKASDKVVEEAIADKFMDFIVNDKESKLRYFINKVFRIIKKFIGINTSIKDKDLNQIFDAIKYGDFSKYKLDEESRNEFIATYDNNVNYKVGKNYDISLINFPLKSDFDSAVNSLKSALFIVNGVKYFSDINKLNTANLKKFIKSCILSNKFTVENKAALQEIVDKFDVFMDSLKPLLESMGIRAIDKTNEEDLADREEGKSQTWDQAAFEYDKKSNALAGVKLFLSTLTDSYFTYNVDATGTKHRNLKVRRNSITGLPMTTNYDIAFAQTLKYLSDVDVYNEDAEHPNVKSLLGECAKLSEMSPFFNVLYNKLSKVDDINLLTQLLLTIKSFNQNFIEVNYSRDSEKKTRFNVDDGINKRAIKQLPLLWSDNFFNSNLVILNDKEVKPNVELIEKVINTYNILKSDISNDKDINDASVDIYKNRLILILNNIGITIDSATIDHILGKNRVANLKDLIVNNKSRVTLDYLFNGTLHTLTGKNIKKNLKQINVQEVFLRLGKNSGLNNLAEVHAIAHPDDSNISVLGPNNSVIYTKTLNCFVSDQVRWLNQHDEATLSLLNNDIYNQSSLILSAINHNSPIKLNTFVNFYGTNANDKGRDYVSISDVEDYIAKMTLTFNNHIIFPTMADKKTWFTISGISLYNKPFKFQVRNGKFTMRFDLNTLERMYSMWLDEFNTIEDYYTNVDKVEFPIKNYHDKGFGGLFRHFTGHYSKNNSTGAFEWIDLNDTLKQALAIDKKNKNHDSINATLLLIRNELFGNNADDATKAKIVHDRCLEYINNNLLEELEQEKDTCARLGIIGIDSSDRKSLRNNLIDLNIIDFYTNHYRESNVESVRDNAEKYATLTAIANHMVNLNISTIEIEKIFTGDLAYYKDTDDQIKRLGAVLSTGDNMRTQWISKSNDPKVQTELNRLLDRQSYTCAIFRDNEIVSAQHEQLQNMFEFCNFRNLLKEKLNLTESLIDELMKDIDSAHEQYPEIYQIAKALSKNDASAYGLNSKGTAGNINQADAAVYLSPQMYRDVVKMLGEWSDDIENAFNIMESDQDWLSNPELYAQSLKTLIKPLKTTYFGFRRDGKSNHNIPVFNKMAQFPMFKVLATGDNKEMYERMTATGKYKGLQPIDQIAFESAVKVGIEGASSLYKDFHNEELNDLSTIHTTTQQFRNLRRQLITDPHTKDRTLFGTLVSTLAASNLILDRIYQEGTPNAITGELIKNQLFSTINAISNKGMERTKRLYLDEDGKLDIKKLSSELIRAVNSSNMGSNLEQEVSLNVDGTDLNVPLSALPDSKWIETSIISDNNKKSVDLELAGGAFIQMSSFGIKSINVVGDNSINKGKRLVNMNVDGSMDAIVSINLFSHIIPGYEKMSFTEAKDWLLQNNIIGDGASTSALGYRIPTLGLSSIAGIRIIDILPSSVGDTIILPDEFTTQTGSDFDIDKLYVARYNYKNGVKVEFIKDESDNFEEFLRNEYIRLMEPADTEFTQEDTLYQRWLNSINNPQDIYAYNSKEANENLLLDTYFAVVTDKKNVNETRLPLDKATGILKKEVLNIIDKFTPRKLFTPYNETSPTFLMNKKYEYSGGKTGIGPFALNNKNHVLTLLVGLKYTDIYLLEKLGFTGLDGINSQNNMVAKRDKDGKYILDSKGNRIMEQELELNILSWLSAMIDAHVDVAKDPYVIRLNVKQYTYNICNFLLRSGFGRSTFYFLPQPILKEMSSAYDKASGIYGVSETESKSSIINKEINRIRKAYLKGFNENSDKKYKNLDDFYTDNSIYESINQLMSRDSLIDLLEAGSKVDKLSSKDKHDYYAKLLLISEAFIRLNKLAQDMSKLVQLSQIDTKRFGNNFVEQDIFIGNIKSLMANTILFNPQDIADYYKKTFLYTKLMNGIVIPSKMFENTLVRAKQSFKNAVSTVLYMIKKIENTNPDLNKKISNGLEGMVRWKFVESKGIDTAKLLYGEESVPTRLYNIKRDIYLGKYPNLLMLDGTIANPLLIILDTLNKLSTDGYESPSIIIKKNLDLDDLNLKLNLIEYWDELLISEYPEIRLFANDLFYYQLITTSGTFTKNGVFNLAPISIIKDSGYAEYMRELTSLYDGITDIREYDNFFLNNWQDNNLVRSVDIYKLLFDRDSGQYYRALKYPMIMSINQINNRTYPLIMSLEDQYPIGVNASKLNIFSPYVKVRIGYGNGPQDYVLYKLTGSTVLNGVEIPLYAVTNKKGLDQGGRVIKEYDNYSNSAMSFNNIENAIMAMENIDKPILLLLVKENPKGSIKGMSIEKFLETYVPIQDYVPYDLSLTNDIESILNQTPMKIELTQPTIEIKPNVPVGNTGKDYTIHSGGAVGADSAWGDIGEEYDIKTNHYYYGEKTPKGNIEISEQDYREGREEVAKAAKANWGYAYKLMKDPLFIRDWALVKYSDLIFAIGTIISKGKKISDKKNETRVALLIMVKGGTGYAVEMAIQHGKDVYVYDLSRKQWFANKDGKWIRLSETPTITSKNFAGIGTRELNEAGEQAIRDVYNKTFNLKSEIDELAEKGKQRIIECKG